MGNKTRINTDFLDVNSVDASSRALKDFYLVSLWSYCEGEKTEGIERITYCSSPKLQFWFNPVEVWGLRNTFLQNTLGDSLQNGLNTYRKIMGWMVWLFLSGAVLTAAEVVMCISTIFCFKSKVISIVSFVGLYHDLYTDSSTDPSQGTLVLAFVASSAAASLATAAYFTLNALFHTVLQPYEIDTSVGLTALLFLWSGVVAAFMSCLLRVLLSFCCCV
jgi:hypothetical protein